MEDTAEILAASAADDIAKYLVLIAESYAEQIEDIEGKIDFLDALKKTLTGRSCYKRVHRLGDIPTQGRCRPRTTSMRCVRQILTGRRMGKSAMRRNNA